MGTKRARQNVEAKWLKQGCDEKISKGRGGISKEKMVGYRIRAAEKLAGILLREAIWSEDGEEVGWISIFMAGYRERSYMMRPMDYYLYGGLAGVAVFIAELAEKTGKGEYCNMRRVLINSLFQHTDGLFQEESTDKLPTGAYSGEASVAFAYMLLYSINEDPIFLQYLWKQCKVTAKWLKEDHEYDVLGGNAGAVIVFLKAYRLAGEVQYLEWAREAGDCLLRLATVHEYGMGWVNHAAGAALTGFAHGTAGIMLALARLGYEAKEEKYMAAAYQAYRYEEHYYREDLQDWEDLRNGERVFQDESGMAWCHGWGGIVMARMEAVKYVEGDFKRELEKMYDFTEKKIKDSDDRRKALLKPDFCLCHGRSGNQALLAYIGKGDAAGQIQKDVEKAEWQSVYEICNGDIEEMLGLQECSNYGMMGGIAGIGYSCLCDLDKTFNILC